MNAEVETMSGFHVRSGWYFERLNDGKQGAGVRIYHDNQIDKRIDVTMSVDDWISVVTELAGGSPETHTAVQALLYEKMGKPEERDGV